ncbi:hypothetical protein [Loigolactobacillus coryniformis]|uniref:hypothetical protein n=1 Tax=Loigolactobacillus coryniformis TaxID=1610 RepID=UPI00345DDBCF
MKVRLDHIGNPLPAGINERQLKTGGWRYEAIVYSDGKSKRVGTFDSITEAKTARDKELGTKPRKTWNAQLSGQRFGYGVALHQTQYRASDGSAMWQMLCSCGTYYLASSNNLKTGRVVSCGHFKKTIKPEMQVEIDKMRKNGTTTALLTRKRPSTNKSGVKGISVVKLKNGETRYLVNITAKGQRHYLGRFETMVKAQEALRLGRKQFVDPIIKSQKE